MFNKKGIAFINRHCNPLEVYDMDRAGEVIGKAIREREERIAAGKPFRTDDDLNEVGKHIAWLIGLDCLIDDRKAIRHLTEKLEGSD